MNKFLLSAVVSASAPAAMATQTQYAYTGHVTEVRNYTGTATIKAHASLGDSFSGSFYYDPDAPFQYLIQPGRALFAGPMGANTVTVNDISVSGSSWEVQLFDSYPNYPDNVFLAAVDNDATKLPAGLQGYTTVIRLNFLAPILDMTLPRTLSLTEQPNPWFSITAYSTDGQAPGYFFWGVHGAIDTLTAVPEPGTGQYLLAAIPLLTLITRRQRRTSGLIGRT
ncbi:hypothetical protein [Roseateles sp. P5_E4]